jgi:Na+/proline symporter
MVESAYKITLVSAFVPLAFGVYWSRANALGGLLAVVCGLTVWIGCEIFAPLAILPPQLAGLIASITGMLIGGILPSSLVERFAMSRAGKLDQDTPVVS